MRQATDHRGHRPAHPDSRTESVRWDAAGSQTSLRRVRTLWLATIPLAVWYFSWLLHPDRVGHPVLFGLLVACELFNLVQAVGFWWTCSKARPRRYVPPPEAGVDVDVLIPTCGEPAWIVEPTVAAAVALRGASVHVWVLDDGSNSEIAVLAARHGAGYMRRADTHGAKAGNLNHALALTSSEFVVVFDADHVPHSSFLQRTLGHMAHKDVAFVQTPQYYANASRGGVAAAAWGQQALFFGPIARGKDGLDATFCCGTNVLFRREALAQVGGFPEDNLTEDFLLSIELHERGWRTVYVPEVLASGIGPEDMASYVSQQHRWARGCLSAVPRVLRSALPRRMRFQYLLSSMFFLTGWTFLLYMTLPVIRLLTGAQPVSAASADQFLLHFLPYFGGAILSVAIAGEGRYSFEAFTLMAASFWVHVHASLRAVLRRPGRFVVTPKVGAGTRQPWAVLPALAAVGVLAATAGVGLWRDQSAGTLNNVAFALLHVVVLLVGVWPALHHQAEPLEEIEPRPGEIPRLVPAENVQPTL